MHKPAKDFRHKLQELQDILSGYPPDTEVLLYEEAEDRDYDLDAVIVKNAGRGRKVVKTLNVNRG